MATAVGNLIKEARLSSGKSQRALGKATQIPQGRISRIESGTLKASPEEIAAIANYFQSLEIIQAYWVESPLHDVAIRICRRMGLPLAADSETTVRQFAEDIMSRCRRIISLSDHLPHENETIRHENNILIGNETLAIHNLATALRLLFCDIKGGA